MPEPTPAAAPVPRPPLDRYGPPPDPRTRRRGTVALAALALAGVLLVIWIGLGVARNPVRWEDVGFTIDGDRVEVVYDVIRLDPSVRVRCRLHALSQDYAQVGVVVVDIAPADSTEQRFASTVATSQPAVTGVVESCWVPDRT